MHIKTACCEIQKKEPGCVIYIETGGRDLGVALATELNIPLFSLNIRYPLSRWMEQFSILRPILWLVKELFYKCTLPQEVPSSSLPQMHACTIVLVDDRISSFRTMETAIKTLSLHGVSRDQITIATGKCSRKKTTIVDYVISDFPREQDQIP